MKSDQLEEETSVSKSFLLIFDYFTYFNKNIELNSPKRKRSRKMKIIVTPLTLQRPQRTEGWGGKEDSLAVFLLQQTAR